LRLTEADTDPVSILFRSKPTTLDAEIFVIPEPSPKKDPLKEPVNEVALTTEAVT
jgi:hypothetical protein